MRRAFAYRTTAAYHRGFACTATAFGGDRKGPSPLFHLRVNWSGTPTPSDPRLRCQIFAKVTTAVRRLVRLSTDARSIGIWLAPLLQSLQLVVIGLGRAVVGILGVRTWRLDRLDRRRAELAEQALSLLYDAPEKFRAIRSIGGFSGEGSTRPKREDETKTQSQNLDADYIPIERIRREATYFDSGPRFAVPPQRNGLQSAIGTRAGWRGLPSSSGSRSSHAPAKAAGGQRPLAFGSAGSPN
jgi:hypothetical protein